MDGGFFLGMLKVMLAIMGLVLFLGVVFGLPTWWSSRKLKSRRRMEVLKRQIAATRRKSVKTYVVDAREHWQQRHSQQKNRASRKGPK